MFIYIKQYGSILLIGSLLLLQAPRSIDAHRHVSVSAAAASHPGFHSSLFAFRGGSTVTRKGDLKSYRLQQHLYLQSRSNQLRQALISRGLDAFKHAGETNDKPVAKEVDWDCALSTADEPKTCLYSFEAEEGSKVIAPLGTDQWITLTSLARLRRQDPTKVERLWHLQFAIIKSWLSPQSKYSMYTHLSPIGTVLSVLLDAPVLLAAVLMGSIVLTLLLTFPIWERILTMILTSSFVWMQWPRWGILMHSPLPLKLLIGQLAWNALATGFARVYDTIRDRLVEYECQIWQECIPLTIVPEGETNDTGAASDDDFTGHEGFRDDDDDGVDEEEDHDQ
jgi:hypothetical protein